MASKTKTMKLARSEPVKVGSKYSVRVTATVRDGRDFVEGEQVSFSIDGSRDLKVSETNAQGVTSEEFEFGVGAHIIDATIEGGQSSRINITIKEEAKVNRPTQLLVETVGDDGDYVITVTVLSDKGPIKDCKVRFSNEKADPPFIDRITDELGVYTTDPHIIFEDREQFVVINVLGTDLRKEVRLNGPRPQRKV